jgi:hypothetical protein
MGYARALLGCAAMIAMLLVSAAPAFAVEKLFEPEGGNVTGTGGEAKLFSSQIICAKNKFSGKIKKTLGISKMEGPAEYEGCLFGKRKVTNFTSPELGLNANETVSFRETKIEVEGGCVVTIVAGGLNLLLKGVTFKNEAVKKVIATIKVPGNEESGILYETNKNKECGTLAEKEKTKTAYSGTETVTGAELVEK